MSILTKQESEANIDCKTPILIIKNKIYKTNFNIELEHQDPTVI
jgi:hypothetical protein